MEGSLRIHISKQAYETYKIQKDNESKLFPQYSDMFFWCVVLGYKSSPDKVPANIGTDRSGTIWWNAFEEEIQKPLLKAICVKAAGTFNILSPDPTTKGFEKFRDILQSYAELGFSVLNTRLGGNYSNDNLNKLMDILLEYTEVKIV